jgi:hypothetical protein
MFTLDRKPTKKPEKKPIITSENKVKKSLEDLSIIRDINKIKNTDLSQFMTKQSKNRQVEIKNSLKNTISEIDKEIQQLNIRESDMSVYKYFGYLQQFNSKLSTNKIFDTILYNTIKIAPYSQSEEHLLIANQTFTQGIANIVEYVAQDLDPISFDELKNSISGYIKYVRARKNLIIERKVDAELKNKNKLLTIQGLIQTSQLESLISVEELMNYIQKENLIPNPTILHHLLSQMDFIRKNLHKRLGTVKFMNQAMFLVKSLPKLSDQTNLISALNEYISVRSDELMWEKNTENDEWE